MSPVTIDLERRIFATEFRDVPGSNGRQRWATAVAYNVVDDYGTIWLPSCFNDGLEARMPTILYGHDWYNLDHVLGQGIDYKDTPEGVDVLFEFADPDEVPSARLAMSLTKPPTPVLKDVSVGFDRQEWRKKDELTPAQLALGAEEAMVSALMDELSIVVRGAVPGAQMRGRRSWLIDGKVIVDPDDQAPAEPVVPPATREAPTVNVDLVVELAKRKAAGTLTLDEAKAALELMGTEAAEPAATAAPPVEPAVVEPPPAAAGAPTLEQFVAAGDIEAAQALLAAGLEAAAVPPPPPLPVEEPATDPALPSDIDIDAALALARRKN
jgi:hypothetical protein